MDLEKIWQNKAHHDDTLDQLLQQDLIPKMDSKIDVKKPIIKNISLLILSSRLVKSLRNACYFSLTGTEKKIRLNSLKFQKWVDYIFIIYYFKV